MNHPRALPPAPVPLLATLAAVATVAAVAACGSFDAAPASVQDAGIESSTADGGGDAVAPPAGCDPSAEPKDAPKCVVSEFGVFADARGGSDGNPGTKESPVKSLTAAVGKLGNKSRVYVCEGTYAEHVKLTTAVSLYGGFACGTWSYSGVKATVAPSDVGYALEVSSVSFATVSDVALEAMAGTAVSPSSIGALVNASTVSLVRVALKANVGHDGSDGASATNYDAALAADDVKIAGHDALATVGGAEQVCAMLCTNNKPSTGGKGGMGTTSPTNGDPGKPALAGGAGGVAGVACAGAGSGSNGAAAATSADGQPATTPGALTSAGWTPSAGAAGTEGAPGQGGGGGGGGASATKGGGGGGGCGGCGGAPASAAQGGGASVALASVASTVTLTASTLTTAKAGNGGKGAAGQDGQMGGFGGIQTAGGCQGGVGGKGGAGGASAGGAGGVSAGVLVKGDKTKVTLAAGTTVTTGDKGTKGPGGKPAVNDGPDGVKTDVLELP
jgi:hypothetical protein